MKRVGDIPGGKKFLTEALLPDGEIIPRSGTEEGNFRFPVEVEVTKKKYPNMLDVLSYEFKKQVHGIYEGEVVIDRIRKQNGQANDKMLVYDKNTGANFSMDIQDVFNIITGMSQGRVLVKKEGDKYIISSKFIMRGHFLSPYSEENQSEQEVKGADTLSVKDIIPSLSKVYITKKGEKYIYLGKGTFDYEGKYIDCFYKDNKVRKQEENFSSHIYIRIGRYYNYSGGDYLSVYDFKTKKSNFILTEDFDGNLVKKYFIEGQCFNSNQEYISKNSKYNLPEVNLKGGFYKEYNITNKTNKGE